MNLRGLLKTTLLCLLPLLWAQASLAHGLHMTTVSVTQRQGDHLSFIIHTSLTDLFSRMEYDGKPSSVIYLANGSGAEIVQFREQILGLLQKAHVNVAQHPLESFKVRTVSAKALRELLLQAVADHVLQSNQKASASDDPRSSYLRIDIDGFIPKGIEHPVLEADFPKELGKILISYSKPQIQTIKPNKQGSHYQQALK